MCKSMYDVLNNKLHNNLRYYPTKKEFEQYAN